MERRTTYYAVYEVPDDRAELSSPDSYSRVVSRHRFEWAARIAAWWRSHPRLDGRQPRTWVRYEHVTSWDYSGSLPRATVRRER